jgi:hypothetical protein
MDLQRLGFSRSLNAFHQANHAGLLAGQLGAAFFLPTLVVPLLLITHGLAFRILPLPQKGLAMRESWYPASGPSTMARLVFRGACRSRNARGVGPPILAQNCASDDQLRFGGMDDRVT